MGERGGALVSALQNTAMFALITSIAFVLIEGLGSTALALFRVAKTEPDITTQYDETLGWIDIPNANAPNKYGTGKYVRTNSRGFRNEREFSEAIPEGKLRLICSGDSFTYGQGVANDQTWCHRLSELDPRFETVNLGQPGYGVDQSYLRYLRDGLGLDHSIHVFAFVHGDFNRMAGKEYSGYGKPVLRIESDSLAAENVPVPRLRWSIHRALKRADLRTIELARRVLARVRTQRPESPTLIDQVGPVALAVFRSIQEISRDRGVVFVFVYLPTEGDLEQESMWRGWLKSTMDDLEAQYVDLTPDLQRVSAGVAASYFIAAWDPSAGHYTEAGNAWVAGQLFERIVDLPPARELATR